MLSLITLKFPFLWRNIVACIKNEFHINTHQSVALCIYTFTTSMPVHRKTAWFYFYIQQTSSSMSSSVENVTFLLFFVAVFESFISYSFCGSCFAYKFIFFCPFPLSFSLTKTSDSPRLFFNIFSTFQIRTMLFSPAITCTSKLIVLYCFSHFIPLEEHFWTFANALLLFEVILCEILRGYLGPHLRFKFSSSRFSSLFLENSNICEIYFPWQRECIRMGYNLRLSHQSATLPGTIVQKF